MSTRTEPQSSAREQPEEDLLEVMGGPEDGRPFPLAPGVTAIGRLEDTDVALMLDATVSRIHARLTIEGGVYRVEDLGSTHGTRVNGRLIQGTTRLSDGDEIQVGMTVLCLRGRTADTGAR